MGPSIAAVQRAAQLFSDPSVRAQLLAWHAQDVPLLEMVDRLGFADLFDPELRAAVAGLKPDEVAILRAAFVAEINRAGDSEDATMPVECGIADVTGPVAVTSAEVGGRSVARVEPSPTR